MQGFLRSYKEIGGQKVSEMSDGDLKTIECAILTLLRRHSIDDRLCCNDANYLTVKRVDDDGFVTVVSCRNCCTDVETTCHDVNWTYEKIPDTSLLRTGDHICWHRCYAIWHHAIVTIVQEGVKKMMMVHYSDHMTVEETRIPDMAERRGCWTSLGEECNALYRVNYQDSYNSDYTVLRARKLLNEKRYNLFERNCEHLSRWCKTGSTSSSQISIAWSSLGKIMLAICLKAIGLLVVLGLLAFTHESQEDKVTDRLKQLQNILLIVNIVVMTLVFLIYLLKTSCSRLAKVILDDSSGSCSTLYNYFIRN